MKTKAIKSKFFSLLSMMLLLSIFAATAGTQEYEKKKEVSKSFNVSMSDLLQVDNRYGNITVTHWSKNEVSIRVEIKVSSSSESRVQENLDRIEINMDKTGNVVSAVTSIKSKNNSGINGNFNENFTINYFISMPSKLSSDLSIKYGNINLPNENQGKRNLHVKYGNLNAGNFSSELELEAKYSNVKLGNMETALIDLGYVGNFTCSDAKKLDIDTKYSNLSIHNVGKLVLEKKYGNIKINSADQISMEMKYSDGTVGTLKKSLDVESLSYGTLTIKELSPSFSEVRVDSHYGNLNLSIPASASFTVIAENMKYGNYKINGFKITDSSKEENDYYRTEVNGGSSRKIYFGGNKYGNVTIKAL